jgi:multidrug efflux pump subunit AcrA (membrane-fusion protein)
MATPSPKLSSSAAPEESSLALPPGGSLLARLPGLDSPDALTLVGRNRLSQALELEGTPDNRYLRLSLYLLAAAALIFFPWAALTPITQVIHASGEVVPEGDVNVIQHLEGGIVAKVDVKDGQEVRQGEVLLELRPNLVESEFRATEQQLKNLMLQQQQLQAAIRGQRVLHPGAVGLSPDSKVTLAQQGLLDSRLANRKDQVTSALAMVG